MAAGRRCDQAVRFQIRQNSLNSDGHRSSCMRSHDALHLATSAEKSERINAEFIPKSRFWGPETTIWLTKGEKINYHSRNNFLQIEWRLIIVSSCFIAYLLPKSLVLLHGWIRLKILHQRFSIN